MITIFLLQLSDCGKRVRYMNVMRIYTNFAYEYRAITLEMDTNELQIIANIKIEFNDTRNFDFEYVGDNTIVSFNCTRKTGKLQINRFPMW